MARRAASKPATEITESAAQFKAVDFFIPPARKARGALALPAPLPAPELMAIAAADEVRQKHRRLLVLVHMLPCWRCLGTEEGGGHDEECALFWHSDNRERVIFRSLSNQNKKEAALLRRYG